MIGVPVAYSIGMIGVVRVPVRANHLPIRMDQRVVLVIDVRVWDVNDIVHMLRRQIDVWAVDVSHIGMRCI
jgi:hypothetical protein